MSNLKVATCGFSVTANIEENARYILDFIKEASKENADVILLPG